MSEYDKKPADFKPGDEIFRGIAGLSACETALALASRGLPLFPCEPGSKRPAAKHGFKAATTNIRALGDGWVRIAWEDGRQLIGEDFNWGAEPGPAGLFVVDIDPKNGGDETWAEFEKRHGPVATLEVLTPSGGRHLYFHGTVPFVNKRLGRGIDTRCFGGYVILPGGQVDGRPRPYTLIEGPIAPLPLWIVEELTAQIEAVEAGAGQAAFDNWQAEGGEGGRFDFYLSLIGDHDGGQGFYDPMVRAAGMGVAMGMPADTILEQIEKAASHADRRNHSLAEIRDRLSKMPGAIRSFQIKDAQRRLAEEGDGDDEPFEEGQEASEPFEFDPEILEALATQRAGEFDDEIRPEPPGTKTQAAQAEPEVAEEPAPFPDASPAEEHDEPDDTDEPGADGNEPPEPDKPPEPPTWNSLEETEAKLAAAAEEFYRGSGARIRLISSPPGVGKTRHYQKASALRYPSEQIDIEDLLHADFSKLPGVLVAHSGDCDRPFRPKVITGSGDRDHAVRPPGGPA